jgi:phenol 2-monooxygenase
MERGQADGVQCRTMEVYESFGLSEEVLKNAFHVLEVTFWAPDGDSLVRKSRTVDTMPGLSHMPHVIYNQALMNGLLLDAMRGFNGQEVDYGYKVKGVEVDSDAAEDRAAYPVTVVTEKDGKEQLFKAKYVLVCLLVYNSSLSNSGRLAMVHTARYESLWVSRWLGTAPMSCGE